MILIVGLGNPGQKFQETWHNLGWQTLNLLQKRWKENYNFSEWKEDKKNQTEISKGKIKNQEFLLIKPLTFMNNSGKSVKSIIDYYKIRTENLLVIHDDVDILMGEIKISKNRGAAGHKGIQSIISQIKTKGFARIRIGIKPKNKINKTEKFVLQKFNKKEKEFLKNSLEKTLNATEIIINEGIEKAMTKFN